MTAPEQIPANPEPHVMHTYGRLPMALSHGRGCWVWDTDGKKYLDGLGGIAVNTLGTRTRSWCLRCKSRSAG